MSLSTVTRQRQARQPELRGQAEVQVNLKHSLTPSSPQIPEAGPDSSHHHEDIGTPHDPNQKLVPNMLQATRSDPCQPTPNLLPDAARGRTLLVKPGGSLDKPLLGLGGQAQAFRHKWYPKKSNPRSIRRMNVLSGCFSSFKLSRRLRGVRPRFKLP